MPNRQLSTYLPEDWVIGQQIGVLAYTLAQYDPKALRSDKRERRKRLVQTLFAKLRDFEGLGLHPTTLPASTLRILSRPELLDGLPADRRDRFSRDWSCYHLVATGRWDGKGSGARPSQLNAAKLIAHQILYSDVRPQAVAQALGAFLSDQFEPLAFARSDLRSVGDALEVLRQPNLPTSSLIEAAVDLSAVLLRYSQSALQTRNAILDQLLAWPLLVFETRAGQPIGATSVPVAVELQFDRQGSIRFLSEKLPEGGRNLSLDGWYGHLPWSAAVGKALWRAKNGNRGQWREEVMDASVSFDFTVADRIMTGAGLAARYGDRSMEAYFSQVVLAKAIGRHAGLAAAVTGIIGPQRELPSEPLISATRDAVAIQTVPEAPNRSGTEPGMPPVEDTDRVLDWAMYWPEFVREKKEFVYTSFKYDRLVLPPLFEEFASDRGEHQMYVETNHCQYLSDVADCVQVGGWRQFKYIRAPDVAHSVHRSRQELPSVKAPAVVRCLSLLATSERPVLQLPSDITAADLFAALHHLNFVRRLQDEFPAPSMSWTAVRAIPEETETRFLHLLLRRVFSSPQEDLDQLRISDTPAEAARVIARALNNLVPDARHRAEVAPNLLIIMGNDRLRTEPGSDLVAAFRPHSFDPVFAALQTENVAPVSHECHRNFVGRTRVILLEDQKVGAPSTEEAFDLDDTRILSRLNTFRFGFTQQMATVTLRHLELDAREVRSKLQKLVRRGVLTYMSGWYSLRHFQKTARLGATTDRQRTVDHFFAGMAFAPYLLKEPIAGLNLAEALLPDNVREAEWHFEQAAQSAHRTLQTPSPPRHIRGMLLQARLAQHRIMRFFDVPNWAQIRKLSRPRKGSPRREAFELGLELLDYHQGAQKPAQPEAISIVASAGVNWWRDLRKVEPAAAVEVFDRTIRLFEEACSAADNAPRHAADQKLTVATYYAAFLRQFGNTDALVNRRAELDAEILEALATGVRGFALNANWFELYGDSLEDSFDAAAIYKLGFDHVPRLYGNLLKHIGSASLSGTSAEALRNQIMSLDPETRTSILAWLRTTKEWFMNPLDLGWVPPRWRAGVSFLNAVVNRPVG